MTTPPGDLVSILEVIESLCKCVSRAVLVERGEDVEVFHKAADRPEVKVIMRVFMACMHVPPIFVLCLDCVQYMYTQNKFSMFEA